MEGKIKSSWTTLLRIYFVVFILIEKPLKFSRDRDSQKKKALVIWINTFSLRNLLKNHGFKTEKKILVSIF